MPVVSCGLLGRNCRIAVWLVRLIPNRPEGPLTHVISFRSIRIVDGILVVIAQDIFHILNRHLAIGFFDTKESQSSVDPAQFQD